VTLEQGAEERPDADLGRGGERCGHPLRDEDLVRGSNHRQICGHVDRIAEDIAAFFDHRTEVYAGMGADSFATRLRLREHPMHATCGERRTIGVVKHAQHAVPNGFHHAPPMLGQCARQELHRLPDNALGRAVAQAPVEACAT
jgi:hypothetical protein